MKFRFLFFIFCIFILAGCGKDIPEPEYESYYAPREASPTKNETVVDPNLKELTIFAKQWEFIPSEFTVTEGDRVRLAIKSLNGTLGFTLAAFRILEEVNETETVFVEFVADKTGTFRYLCPVFCGVGSGAMVGKMNVIKKNITDYSFNATNSS